MGSKIFIDAQDIQDIHELADVISEHLENPITIEDFNHRLIAYSTHGTFNDKARMETIMERRVPDWVLDYFWREGVIQKLMRQDEPIRINAKDEIGFGSDRVAVSMRTGHEVIGFIWVLEINKHLDETGFEILKEAVKVVKPRVLQKQTRRQQLKEKYNELFLRLILGYYSSNQQIIEKMQELNLKLPSPFSVFVFDAIGKDAKIIYKEIIYLISNLKDLFSFQQIPLWMLKQNKLVMLTGGPLKDKTFMQRGNSFVQEIMSRVEDRFGSEIIRGAFGKDYHDYTYVEQAYQQALDVLRMKMLLPDETRNIHGYSDMGIYRLLPTILEKNREEGYCNDRLEKLKKYDRENQSHLLHTLRVFLQSVGKINTTAQRLHIHPNTLNYRLKRISEEGDINLHDPNQRITLYIDILCMDYNKTNQ